MAKHIPFATAVNQSESWAFKFLREQLPDDYQLLTNIEIPSHTGQALEVDALVIGQWGVFVVDVKGYTGELEVGQHAWMVDGRPIDNALAKANQVGRILAGNIRQQVPYGEHAPWCQGMVFITGREGSDVHLAKLDERLSIYGPEQIIEALTEDWGSTAKYKHAISPEQRDYVLDTLGQVALVEARSQKLQDFHKDKKLFAHQGVEIWQAHYQRDGLKTDWLLKILIAAEFANQDSYRQACNKLNDQFQRLQALSGCSGVPQCAPLIDDGEQLALPLRRPRGMPIDIFDHASADTHLLLNALRRAATSLQQIHNAGYSVGNWQANQVFISERGEIEFIEIANNLSMSEDLKEFAETFQSWLEYLPSAMLQLWFNAASQGLSSSLDQLRSELSTLLSNTALSNNEPELNQRYDFIEQVRQGDHSEIWRARHRIGGFHCAISVYRDIDKNWLTLNQQYLRLKEFYHPNIERFIELGQSIENQKLSLFLSREWIPGNTLRELLGHIIPEQAGHWFDQLCQAMDYLHSFDLHHGGVSLRNIVCSGNKATLVNFGLGLDAIGDQNYRSSISDQIWNIEEPATLDRLALASSFIIALTCQELPERFSPELIQQLYPKLPEGFLNTQRQDWLQRALSPLVAL